MMKTFIISWLMAITCMVQAQTAPKTTQVWGGMMHVKIDSLDHTAPFTTCQITVLKYANGTPLHSAVTKTVFLKNIPAKTVQCLDEMKVLMGEQSRLAAEQHQLDLERIANNDAAIERYNRDNDAYQADKVRFDYAFPQAQAELKKLEQERAMPTGQIYAGKEVWDCGLRPGEAPRL